MNKDILDRTVTKLKENKFDIKFECMLFAGKANLRGIFIYNPDEVKSIKSILDKEILKNIKLEKTLTWYLGDRKEIVLLKFKKPIDVEIKELEMYNVNNYP